MYDLKDKGPKHTQELNKPNRQSSANNVHCASFVNSFFFYIRHVVGGKPSITEFTSMFLQILYLTH